ncbi:hypothetical protein TNCV_1717331 [Trichonephila clavipes]|nr:hypothetical protein TNCV_1717331 [Trichonephila clavipes]
MGAERVSPTSLKTGHLARELRNHPQTASTDGGVLWEAMRVNVVQVREKNRSLRDPIEARSCVRGEAGGRERPNEDETGVTSRGREVKSAGREGLTAPKRVRGAPKTQWEGECCFFFAAGMKRKESARRNLQTPQQVERSWSQL